jgi:hypothetical protein
MRKPLLAALAVALAGSAAAADFEGVIDARLTVGAKQAKDGGSGIIRLHVAAAGSRAETEMTSPMGSVKMTVLHLKAKPGLSYLVDDEKKTYSEIQAPAGDGDPEESEKVTVQKLGNERVAGYDCAHALLTSEAGEKAEIWSTKALGGAEAFWAAQTGEDRRGSRKFRAMARSLRDAGLDGWPLKFRTFPEQGREVVWETTRVEKRSVPSSLFSLAGYTKAEAGMGGMGQVKLSPEQQRKMEEAMKRQQEAMKKMSPEQRQQMEELMKQLQGAGAPGKRD